MPAQPLLSAGALRLRHSPMRSCGRAALERIVWIHEQIGRQQTITAEDAARVFEVSSRTIKRDLDFMRDRIGVPIAWNSSERTYYYTRPCDLLPLLRIEADEALALALASETFGAWRGSALGQALTSALEKIASVVGGAASVSGDGLGDILFAPADPAADAEHRFFAFLLEAIKRQRELSLAYQKPKTNQPPELRTVHPLHLAHLDHRWMLVAYDVKRADRRSFLLARIQAAEWTGRRFEPPAGFSIDAHLRGSVGRFSGTRDYDVRIAVDAIAAPYLRERPWHVSQKIVERAEGAIEVFLRLNNLIDIERRILACGVHAEVLEPRELRDSIRTTIAALADRYAAPAADPLRWLAAEEE